MEKNKTRKYFKYAIGEIVLVVIGILIALQINNWNENRKLKGAEIKLLQNFRTSIETDTITLNYYINEFSIIEKKINRIARYIEEDLAYSGDSLQFAHATATWWVNIDQEIFATVTSGDLNNISNDVLKKEIISYYSYASGKFDTSIKNYEDYIHEYGVRNILNTRFTSFAYSPSGGQNQSVPNNWEALKKDKEYRYFLKTQQSYFFWYVKLPLDEAKEKADQLLGSISKELKKFDKK
jgi:hypothetical protein